MSNPIKQTWQAIWQRFNPVRSSDAAPASLFANKSIAEGSIDPTLDEEIRERLDMIKLTEEDMAVLRRIKPLMEPHLQAVIDDYYDSLMKISKLKAIIYMHSSVERLKGTMRRHLLEILDGHIDTSFMEKRLRIAMMHNKIGLEPKWYMAAFEKLQSSFKEHLAQELKTSVDREQATETISKMFNFEQQVVLDAYEKENIRERESQYEKVKDELKANLAMISAELAALTEETSASVEELVSTSNEVNRSLSQSVDQSQESRSLAATGQEDLQALGQRISSIRKSADHMEETVQQLNRSSAQIHNIVLIVKDIADQTKLLSLNASIEAARAGEHGRGFAVVAGEVQKLSDDTKQAVQQITELVGQTSKYTASVVKAIGDTRELVTAGESEAVRTEQAFADIVLSMESSLQSAASVKQDMDTLVGIIEEIGQASYRVATTAETLNSTTQDF
ncbi:globin-coupled sensor protein [Gorillibacterium timonense]|uniref:globin-coupled sensor protein n=1 Tax=Gorillibacterium timonense TaxID=1689269 RepID=UPI00071E0F34|nr:globin-coupled sensor protein [Gorillibacterium timonense]